MAEIDNTSDDPRHKEPLVLGGLDYAGVTDDSLQRRRAQDHARVEDLLPCSPSRSWASSASASVTW